MKKTTMVSGLLLLAFASCAQGSFTTLIDFEAPLPPGLVPNTFFQLSAVNPNSELTNQYENLGVLFSTYGGAPYAVLVDLTGQAPSGVNGIGPANSSGELDYTQSLDVILVQPGTLIPAVTDGISIQGDLEPVAGNVNFSAYDINGNLLTSGSAPDTAGGLYQLSAPGIHEFRISSESGTVAYDNLSLDTPTAVTATTPEPETTGSFALGIAALAGLRLRAFNGKPKAVAKAMKRASIG